MICDSLEVASVIISQLLIYFWLSENIKIVINEKVLCHCTGVDIFSEQISETIITVPLMSNL